MQSSMQHALALMTALVGSWCVPTVMLLRAQRALLWLGRWICNQFWRTTRDRQRVRAAEYASQS
jgi:hypothetical protein